MVFPFQLQVEWIPCHQTSMAKTVGFNNLMGRSSFVLRFSIMFWLRIRKITFKPLSNFSKQNCLPIQISVMYPRLRLYIVRPNLTQHKVSLSQYNKGRIIQGTQNPGDTKSQMDQPGTHCSGTQRPGTPLGHPLKTWLKHVQNILHRED